MQKCGCEKETVEHFLRECPGYWKETGRGLRNKGATGNWKMKYLLGDHEGVKKP
jgi:hypothetical protein